MSFYVDKIASLTPYARDIICDKDTEHPFTGSYQTAEKPGTYLCRRCGLALFRTKNQFHSGCGWPSFDQNIPHALKEEPDADGLRTEILCSRCNAHMGHVFLGEGYTKENRRHCVNAQSLDFVTNETVLDTEEAIVAGGCFWGIEHYLGQVEGVLKVEVGYTGGHLSSPTYEQVCQGNTGHYEAARVIYDREKTSYHTVLKRFFEIHDPEQQNGQGPDIGEQYKSAIFYYNEKQEQEAEELIAILTTKGFAVETLLYPVQIFWPAEDYHQAYYTKTGKLPYCHRFTPRFGPPNAGEKE